MSQSVPDRFRGALLGSALGDAVGAPFEGQPYVTRDEVRRWLDPSEQLRWTDDTHMALTLGVVLRDSGGTLGSEQLGGAFAKAYAAEPWRGYGAGPPQVFALARRGMSFVAAAGSLFEGSGSYGNGAAMRVTPVALVAGGELERAEALARAQTEVTHTHPEAVDGAAFVATAISALATRAAGSDVYTVLGTAANQLPSGVLRTTLNTLLAAEGTGEDVSVMASRIGTGVAARESIRAAVAALLVGSDVVSTLQAAVHLGGDTDTIAAMAGAMGGAVYGTSGIPDRLLARLEAREQLDQLATALLMQ